MLGAGGNDHRIGHGFLVIILETVLCHLNPVFLFGVTGFNGLGVANTHSQLFGAIGGLVLVNLANHTSNAGQVAVHGAKLLKIKVALVLIFNFVGQEKVIVASVCHYSLPP